MLKQLSALILCAIFAFTLAGAADSKPEAPATIKPIPVELRAELAEAIALFEEAQKDQLAAMSEIKERIFNAPEYQQMAATVRDRNAKRMALVGKARAASGAPVDCDYKPGTGWYRQTQQGTAPCTIEPKAEPKKAEVKK